LVAFVVLSLFAIGTKSDLIDSIKDGVKEVEAAYERTKCINKFIDCEYFFLIDNFFLWQALIRDAIGWRIF
jgi:hypothetical protein